MPLVVPDHCAVRRRFQFTLRRLLVFTAVVAVLVAVSLSYYRRHAAGQRAMLLVQAMHNGNVEEVDQLLKADPRLAHGRQHGAAQSSHTALQNALLRMHPANGSKIIDRILQENPDVNERSAGGENALHVAAALNKLSEVQRLIQLGADVNALDDRGNTPLHRAIQSDSNGQLVKRLLDNGADPNAVPPNPPPDWKSPLSFAVESGYIVIVTHLLDAGAEVNARDARGRTALHFALAEDNRPQNVATLLIERGADLTAKDAQLLIPGERKDGYNSSVAALLWWRQIFHLFDQNDTQKLDDLLKGAPQAISFRFVDDPPTMLHCAMAAKRLDLLDYLLVHRPNPVFDELDKVPPFHEACWTGDIQSVKKFLDEGTDVHLKDPYGQTPLHVAAREHRRDVLRLLLDRGANVRARDHAGATVLDSAFERSFVYEEGPKTHDLLREAGHPPTVLFAAATGDFALLQELARDALDRVYTRTGVRPLHAAVLGNQPRVIDWLFEQGVEREPLMRQDWRSNHRQSPLLVALSYNLTDIAILLIRHGADVNRPGDDGYPVHLVIRWDRDPRILETLLAHGANPMLKYKEKTAVELAKEPEPKHLKLKNRDRYLELLEAATPKSAAGR
jgi:ankyrin repeat protein